MSTGGIERTARIVGEAVSVSMTNIEVNARIVGEAVSVGMGGIDSTARIVGRECANRGKTNVNINAVNIKT